MGRWTQYDEDEHRLPEGMKRVGYDADEGRYYFRDSDGTLYRGPEGSEYGHMTPVPEADAPAGMFDDTDDDLEAAPTRPDGYQPLATDASTFPRKTNGNPYRSMFPFFLIIAVVLLLVWRLLPSRPVPKACPPNALPYKVKSGDSCWEISSVYGCTLETFKEFNPSVNCDKLMPRDIVCLPKPATE